MKERERKKGGKKSEWGGKRERERGERKVNGEKGETKKNEIPVGNGLKFCSKIMILHDDTSSRVLNDLFSSLLLKIHNSQIQIEQLLQQETILASP